MANQITTHICNALAVTTGFLSEQPNNRALRICLDVVRHAQELESDNFLTKLTPVKTLPFKIIHPVGFPSPTPGSYPCSPQARACGFRGDRIFLIVSTPSHGLCTSDKKQFYRLPGTGL